MKSPAQQFLTKDEQDRVTRAVQEAEKKTSGEIVPMIVSASDDYPLATVSCSVSFALPLSLLVTHLVGKMLWMEPQNMYLFLLVFFLVLSGFYLLCRNSRWLKYFFLPAGQVEKKVRDGALGAFYSEQLYKTAQENGILIYISVLEKKVWILGDHGINEKIEQTSWDSIVSDLTDGIREGASCAAICNAIAKTGSILQEHFPYHKDDQDELHNLIIR